MSLLHTLIYPTDYEWKRARGIVVYREKNLLYGSVDWYFLMFESEAIEY